ncbi:hypothetical protein [Streptomyces sp. CC208A]|uniref:hypothetical protein n=1 Tax=Streptomyces sp. CC208A TaxID=3044573 RepID=UPI0024A9F20C|nr:hypothetical protein [Streptomyces sp. CC208A]
MAVTVAAGLLFSPQAWGPALFALVLSFAFLVESGRHEVMEDYERRMELGSPPLMEKGDPYTRGLFDSLWLIRYRRRMRKHPLRDERPSA